MNYNYIDLLQYLAGHPIQAAFIVLVQFALVMKLHNKFHNPVLHIILGAWFIPQDVIVNAVLVSIIGLEPPREFLATTRFKRWKKYDGANLNKLETWRRSVAGFFCRILNRFDMGHC